MMFREVLLLLAMVLFVEGQRAYDCRRSGTLCEGTCLTTGNNAGNCQCGLGRIGYDCSIQGTLRTAGTCNNQNCVGTNQICYNNGGPSDLCACTAGFTGLGCDTERVSTTCDVSTMSVTIIPLPGANFNGKIFVKNQGNVAQCQFSNPTPPSTSFTQTFNLNSCGITSTVQANSGNTIYAVRVVVQYSTLYETIYDEEHVANCIHTTDGQVQGVIGVQPAASRPGQVVTGTTTVTHMEIIRASSGAEMAATETAIVGEDLELRLVLDSTQYQSLFATSCTAYSSTNTANRASKVLVTGGCIGLDALNVVRPPMTRNQTVITIPIDAFKFDNSQDLVFQCDLLVCRAGDNRCNPVSTCGPVGTGFGRKKRQAGNETEVETVQSGVRVFSFTNIELTSCPASTFESCVQSVPFLTVTIIFGVLLLVALIASAFLCFRFTRSEARPEGKTESAYYNKGISTA
ncbi:EGF-like domain-containing protein 2 [Liolophura sinensis]|uniref:EGF-like domain-containing protein 2 n=1 Tax=Liolophura sinensis TaxID=3198878 RepID=UPI0031581D94